MLRNDGTNLVKRNEEYAYTNQVAWNIHWMHSEFDEVPDKTGSTWSRDEANTCRNQDHSLSYLRLQQHLE